MQFTDVDKYELKGRPVKAAYSTVCNLNEDHDIIRGKKIGRVRLKDNRLVTLPGWACQACIRDMTVGGRE